MEDIRRKRGKRIPGTPGKHERDRIEENRRAASREPETGAVMQVPGISRACPDINPAVPHVEWYLILIKDFHQARGRTEPDGAVSARLSQESQAQRP